MALNGIAILAAAVAAWLFGALYYGVLGRVAPVAMRGRVEAAAPAPAGPPVAALVLSFFAELVMAALLAGLLTHLGGLTPRAGLVTGLFCWLAFVATTLVTNDAYARERPAKTAIDAGHWLGVLLIQGLVIGLLD